jgi:hypothetical protein
MTVSCSIAYRHRSERKPQDRIPADEAAIARLFDPTRDPSEQVRADEWLPASCSEPGVRELFACETVAATRRWFVQLER